MDDQTRIDFEAFWAWRGKRNPGDLERDEAGDYRAEHVQRHWWTFQQSRSFPSVYVAAPPTFECILDMDEVPNA